jgi:hypothetical protein
MNIVDLQLLINVLVASNFSFRLTLYMSKPEYRKKIEYHLGVRNQTHNFICCKNYHIIDINGINVTENVVYFPKDGVNVEFSGTLPHMIHADSYIGLVFCIYNYKCKIWLMQYNINIF